MVAQEANGFYMKHGKPRWWGGSGVWTGGQWFEMKVRGARDGEDVADGDAGGNTFEPRWPTEDRNGNSSDGEDWSE